MTQRFKPLLFILSVPLLLSLAGCPLLRRAPENPPPPPEPIVSRAAAELLALFPQETGTTWHYEGFAEYMHDMELLDVERGVDTVIHRIEGRVADLSDGESDRDFGFAIRHIFDREELRERIDRADTPFPHWLDGLILLKQPLKQGASWQQQLEVRGETRTVTAEITAAARLDDEITYTVRYRMPLPGMPDGIYEEVRVFRTGQGVAHFEKTFGPTQDERFTYDLRRLDKG